MQQPSIILVRLSFAVILLLSACAPTRLSTHSPSTEDVARARHCVIEEYLYSSLGTRGDTLLCRPVYRASTIEPGTFRPVLYSEALSEGLDEFMTIHMLLRHAQQVPPRGDTLRIPLSSVELVSAREVNPTFAVGSAVGIGTIALLLVAAAATVGMFGALLSAAR